ncbi:MAG: hydantoinase/oxoprolinase family protein [Acidobacteria bacterium]|nr:hydantoinase/oxoprolinase family protein [Acidobacteriota bacterium]
MRIGIDAGGTFTDFIVMHGDGRVESFKIRSNPTAPDQVILEGIRRAAASARDEVVHGSTVATNALLERKGVRTAFVTTAGFEDLLTIGRQNRRELYNLTPALPVPAVPRELCFGAPERVHYDGTVARQPLPRDLAALAKRLRAARVEAVAICLLHSYREPANEKLVLAALHGLGYVCASHEVSPEFREFERASTTVINAYVGPLMDRYLGRLEQSCPCPVSILQSNGGSMNANEARRHAVRTVLSGPAGGVIGAAEMARRSGFTRVLGFDMGGTSTDVSLCEGAPRETTESIVDGFPIRVPMLDIHTVGAGGGSIARVDAGGLLRVGPGSAGAVPGPACYGTGEHATVTDAHVVLGRISAVQFLGGQMRIDEQRAAVAVGHVAAALGLSLHEAAEGILRVANANMERAIRTVSVERGHDPREFALVAFGGGGGLHACDLAAQLEIRTVLVPRYAEGLSALGMLLADRVRDYSAGVLGRTDPAGCFADLDRQARAAIPGARIERTADLRYAGQSYELTVPWTTRRAAEALFHREHERLYGYASPDRPVEVVTVRVRARKPTRKPRFPPLEQRPAARRESRRIWVAGRWHTVPVLLREQVPASGLPGPLLITDYGATVLVPPGWKCTVDAVGNLIAANATGARPSRGSSRRRPGP